MSFLKLNIFFVTLFTFFLSNLSTAKAASIAEIKNIWKTGNYTRALSLLLDYREEPGGRNAYVDYMIGTSACRIPSKQKVGLQFLKWLKNNYAIPDTTLTIVSEEINNCQNISSTPNRPINDSIIITQRSRVSGKGGIDEVVIRTIEKPARWECLNIYSEGNFFEESNLECFEPIVSFPLIEKSETYESITIDNMAKTIKDVLGENYHINFSPSFLMITRQEPNLSQGSFVLTSDFLEKSLKFFSSEYDIQTPNYLITAYYLSNQNELIKLGYDLHRTKIPNNTIGYSIDENLTIVGTRGRGTLIHELFHLVVHQEFSDIPAWLDEGMASLYEVANLKDYQLIGLPNWRGNILQENFSKRPSIDQLIKMNWTDFYRNEAVNYATARYFALYLQEKGLLKKTFSEFKNRDPLNIEDSDTHSIDLIENIIGKTIIQIDKDFENWFSSL